MARCQSFRPTTWSGARTSTRSRPSFWERTAQSVSWEHGEAPPSRVWAGWARLCLRQASFWTRRSAQNSATVSSGSRWVRHPIC